MVGQALRALRVVVPLGLVVTALSLAAQPGEATAGDFDFCSTIGYGLCCACNSELCIQVETPGIYQCNGPGNCGG